MTDIDKLLQGTTISPPLAAVNAAAECLSEALDMSIYGRSVVASGRTLFALARRGAEKRLVVAVDADAPVSGEFSGEGRRITAAGRPLNVRLCPLDAATAEALRRRLDFLRPVPAGIRPTMGCGDRLGLATPAHVQAVRDTGVFPVLAQQSIREMERTGRSPQQVMDSAMWGVFEEGWRDGYGADADHLKTTEHIDRCLAAGFVMFTVDPGDHVDGEADEAAAGVLEKKFAALPWEDLEATPEEWRRAYEGTRFDLGEGMSVRFEGEDFVRAAVKYGRAVAHTVRMYRHLVSAAQGRPFELEMSVDETETPTTPAEHYFVAAELKRLGVRWVSLAPRFVGEFEKGVDYRGCLAEFKHALQRHVAIARRLGPYKISFHSGSDKFTIYPIARDVAEEMIHLKTAGTSYLEAIRAIAQVAPGLFREILAYAHERYDEDRATYHVSAETSQVPKPDELRDADLPGVLDRDPGRQLLHVTYGSVLTATDGDRPRFKTRLLDALRTHEEAHYEAVSRHIRRHVEPIAP